MEILLTQDVESLGQRGDRLNVAKGYYRNYLGPKGLAVPATEGNLRHQAELAAVAARRDKKHLASAEGLAAQINGRRIVFKMQANEEGHLYGSVTEQSIAKALADKGLKVESRQIQLEEHIKALGDYEVTLSLHRNVQASVNVSVVQE